MAKNVQNLTAEKIRIFQKRFIFISRLPRNTFKPQEEPPALQRENPAIQNIKFFTFSFLLDSPEALEQLWHIIN